MAELNTITVDSSIVASKKRRQEIVKALARNGVTMSSIDVSKPVLMTTDDEETITRKITKIKTAQRRALTDTEKGAIRIN